MIRRKLLEEMYLEKVMSVQAIADKLGYSRRGIKYWLDKHNIPTRSMSEAIYLWHNPEGDPWKFKQPKTPEELQLFGMGLGLYWGEGTKSNKNSVRLGNTDPELVKTFMDFLVVIFGIDRKDLKFSLQIFSDIDPNKALDFWTKALKIEKTQFGKVVVTKSGSLGTYRKKSEYGVVTVYYHNKKLRDTLIKLLPM